MLAIRRDINPSLSNSQSSLPWERNHAPSALRDSYTKRTAQPALPVSLLFNGQARLPLKLRPFIDFVTPRLRRRLTDATL